MADINSSLNVVVRNKDLVLFKDFVASVTSYNDRGVFDILPEHENFISLIKNSIIIHKNKNENQEIKIDNGVVKVYKNNVFFYINFEKQV
ncbi:hypothetical protein HYT32_00080 [Candidatus Roizmanbacteria bacterium]|nr:hypothetical protein [Candidatus Roizmanbacteria bacterium]